MKIKYFFVVAMLLLSLSCEKEVLIELYNGTQVIQKKFDSVDKDLWPYFQMFEIEASRRGWDVDLNKSSINATIAIIDESDVIGQCQYNHQHPNEITIDRNFWTRSSDLYKEYVVFHELGHCFLWRSHDESSVQGVCSSIMNSGISSCNSIYNNGNRNELIDELFENSIR